MSAILAWWKVSDRCSVQQTSHSVASLGAFPCQTLMILSNFKGKFQVDGTMERVWHKGAAMDNGWMHGEGTWNVLLTAEWREAEVDEVRDWNTSHHDRCRDGGGGRGLGSAHRTLGILIEDMDHHGRHIQVLLHRKQSILRMECMKTRKRGSGRRRRRRHRVHG